MIERVLKLETAAADKSLARGKGELVSRSDRVAGFAGQALVDPDLAGEDRAFGLLAAFTESALN